MIVQTATENLADLLEQLGGIAPGRIRLKPPPGTATEHDVVEVEAKENHLCELVDGVLVEKALGYLESILAGAILASLRAHVVPRNLGHVSGADGMMRLFAGLVRIPDVAYASWERFPGGSLPEAPIPDLAPDLAVEVLSAGNTVAEMERKRQEYFEAGVRLVWIVDPRSRTVTVFTSPEDRNEMSESDVLDGGEVLPGLSLSLCDLFAELDRMAGREE